MRAVIALFLTCSIFLWSAAHLRADVPQVLILDPETPVLSIGQAMRFAPDVGDTLFDLAARHAAGQLSSSFPDSAAELQPYQPLWALLEIRNGALADGRPADDWRLASEIYGLIALEVFLIRPDGVAEQLLAHDIRTPFDPADYAVTRLVSAPFELHPKEQALLVVRVVHGPAEALDLRLERGAFVDAKAFSDGLSLAAFYAFLMSCLLIFAVFSALMRAEVGVGYAALLLLGLAFVAYLDNFLFRWLYPMQPRLHLPMGIALLLVTTAVGYLTAALALMRLSSQSRLARPMAAIAGVALLSIVGIAFLPPEVMVPWAYVLLGAMLVAQVLSAFRWDKMGKTQRPVSRVIPVIAFAGLGTVILLALVRSQPGDLSIPWLIKGTYATLALSIMAGLSAGLIDMRRSHAAALAREMDAVRKEAQSARDLLQAERDYARMRDLADQRRMQMATMTHDIRQPLSALRLSFERMTQDAPMETRQHLQEAFDYIQGLTGGHLDTAREEARDEAPEHEEETEPYSLSLVLDAVGQMFGDEARLKGLELRIVPSGARVAVPPLHLMRILSNLVSNAVKYTAAGRVLVGVRRRPGAIDLQVLDTGHGMSEDELARNMQVWESGAESGGHGLGLAICQQLATQNGLMLSIRSRPGAGSVFSLRIPRGLDGCCDI